MTDPENYQHELCRHSRVDYRGRQNILKLSSVGVQWRRQDFVLGGAQVWHREKTENNQCISYHPRQQPILTSMRHCIRPVCHSNTVYNNKNTKVEKILMY